MTNSKRSGVPFKADGQDFTYKLSTNALCRYEDLTDETILQALVTVQKTGDKTGASIQFRRVRGLLWAGLPEGVTLEEAGDVVDAIGIKRAFEIITKGAELAFPAPKSEAQAEGNGKTKAKAAT